MNDRAKPVLITGANGHLGKKLIEALAATPVRAVVRSSIATKDLEAWISLHRLEQVQVLQCDFLDPAAMIAAASGCAYAVHLVGIIKEVGSNTFARAHIQTTQVLLEALADSDIEKVCYLSILGAAADSANPCLASRGQAEQQFLAASLPTLVLRIPMVLGEGDYASRALLRKARVALGFGFRDSSLEQPIYAGDVIRAIIADIDRTAAGDQVCNQLLELAGPESLSRTALVQRASKTLGTRPKTVSLPLGLGLALAWLLEKTSQSPPVSRAMLGVLDHDDNIDPQPACRELSIELTPLDDTLTRCLRASG
ncbi:MAG: NAD(P)H-binding protein [Gammaproteobacteria bacterium]|nr:NAD(P)H-binding protein [Gammaproteobacteria bacterium]